MRLRKTLAPAAVSVALLAVHAAPASADLPFRLPTWAPAQLRAMVREQTQPPHHRRNPFTVAFELHAANGYEVAVTGSENRIVLVVGRKHVDAITGYVVRGTVTRKRLVADFGAFGKLSMRFHPPKRGPGSDPHAACRFGRNVLKRHGVFRGSLSFDGENQYVSLRAHRARGEVISYGSRCKGGGGPLLPFLRPTRLYKARDNGPEPRFLFAGWRHNVDSAGVIALDLLGIRLFLASSQESEGRMAIVRLAFAIGGKPRTFTLDDAITHATLSPPAPFHGTGVYDAAPDGTKTWGGSLSVNFPGTPGFVLTGPPFEPEVEAGFEHSLSTARLFDR